MVVYIKDTVGRWSKRKDFVLLASGAAVVAGALLFVYLAGGVGTGHTARFDEVILLSLRHSNDLANPIGPHWVENGVRDITALGSLTLLGIVTLAVMGFFWMRGQYSAVILLLTAMTGAALLNVGLKNWFDRPRPEFVPHLMVATSASFPSGHSMLAAVAYLTLGSLLSQFVKERRLKLYFLVVAFGLTFLVGISRVYLGVHYPTDVLAGWLVGLLWGLVCWAVTRYLQQRGKTDPPE